MNLHIGTLVRIKILDTTNLYLQKLDGKLGIESRFKAKSLILIGLIFDGILILLNDGTFA